MENNGKLAYLITSLSNTIIIPAPRLRYSSFLLSKVTNKKFVISLQGYGSLFEKKSKEWFEPRLVGIGPEVLE